MSIKNNDRHDGEGDLEVYGADDLDDAERLRLEQPHMDELAFKAALRKRKWAYADEQAPYERVNPPSANRGTLGGQQSVLPGNTAPLDPFGAYALLNSQNNAMVAFWNADADVETMPITVSAAPVQQAHVIGNTIPLRPFCILKFGTRGFMLNVEADIGRGTQFTVSGSGASLQVAVENVLNSIPGPDDHPMLLSGMLSFFRTVRTTPVTRTRYIDSLAHGASVAFVVPQFARNVILWRALQSVPFRLRFLDSNAAVQYTVTVATLTDMATPIQLAGDIVAVEVTNDDLVNAMSGRLVFELAL